MAQNRTSVTADPKLAGAASATGIGCGWQWPTVLFVVVFAVDVACPSGMTADSIRQVSVAVAMVHYHTIGLDHLRPLLINHNVAVTIVGHHVYPYFPWGGALFAVPWVVAYDVADKVGLGSGSIGLLRSGHDWPIQVLAMSTVVAATTVVIYAIAVRVLNIGPDGRRRRWAAGVALVFAFATPAWSTASRSLWEHGPSMLCLAVALLFALRVQAGERGWVGFGAALGSAYAMRPTDALPIAIMGLWVLIWQRRHLARVCLGGAGPLAILLVVDLVAYRQLLTPYYTQGQSFELSSTALTAAAGNLVSPSRGLIIFVPLVILSAVGVWVLWRERRLTPFWVTIAAIPIAHWLLISPFKHWWAGDSYGPRLWTDMMPLFVLLALPAVNRLALRAIPAPAGGQLDGGSGRCMELRGPRSRRNPAVGVVLEQRANRRGRTPRKGVELVRPAVRTRHPHLDLGSKPPLRAHPRRSRQDRMPDGAGAAVGFLEPRQLAGRGSCPRSGRRPPNATKT